MFCPHPSVSSLTYKSNLSGWNLLGILADFFILAGNECECNGAGAEALAIYMHLYSFMYLEHTS